MPSRARDRDEPWWRSAVLYQIYPRSFADSNADGVGDLRGITGRLDYLRWLGVDAIWLSPITVSPNADWGYDVADFRAVEPELGTMADFAELVAAAHERDIRVLLDFVPNHTSDRHPWFVEARASRDSARRDWYVRDLLTRRRRTPDLQTGRYAVLDAPEGIWAWRRGAAHVVAVSSAGHDATVEGVEGRVLVATDRSREGERCSGSLLMRSREALLVATPAG